MQLPIQHLQSTAFATYGRILDLDTQNFCKTLRHLSLPTENNVLYEPTRKELEVLPILQELMTNIFGGLPIELGHCSGYNNTLNAVEYHRSSEIDIAATDMILLLGRQQDIDCTEFTYQTKRMEAFLVPQGTAVELYATTLHYAPCGLHGQEFRAGIALPKGTNEPLTFPIHGQGEAQLLFATNKWLIAHAESGLEKDGAHIGLLGENLRVE